MNQNIDSLIDSLMPAIDNKCEELKAARKEKLHTRLFIIVCILVAVIPALLVFAGISVTLIVVPILFMSVSVVMLMPVLISGHTGEQGGENYEQA